MLLLEGDLSLPHLLRQFVEQARSMVGARYAALGVLTPDRSELAQFITAGLDPEEERRIGSPPKGRGVLGLLITRPEPIRLADIRSHPESYGFPPNHPPMTSFLGVPVKVRDQVYGNLYLTDKVGWSEFTSSDQALVEALSVAAGVAIENAQLHRRVREAAVLEDRDRIAQDLHDAVIQRLFAVGLSLQGITRSMQRPDAPDRLEKAIADIDDTIRQIRTTIFELGTAPAGGSVRAEILAVARDVEGVAGFTIPVQFDGPIDSDVPASVAEHLVATVREALANVERHSRATSASVRVSAVNGVCAVEVVDNGIGLAGHGPRSNDGGLGLVNLRRRAEKLGGELCVESPQSGGTRLSWRVPLLS